MPVCIFTPDNGYKRTTDNLMTDRKIDLKALDIRAQPTTTAIDEVKLKLETVVFNLRYAFFSETLRTGITHESSRNAWTKVNG